VLGLKGNQSALQEAVEDFWTVAQGGNFAHVAHAFTEELDKDHGRLEVRRYWISEDLRTLPDTDRWVGLRSIGMVERTCLSGDTTSIERRYFINSIPADARASPTPCAGTGAWRTACTGAWMWSWARMPAASARATPQPS
jgi:hypothetical protein